MREDRAVCISFTAVPNLTDLIVRKGRRLLAVTVGCRASGLSDEDYLTSVPVHILMWARGGHLDGELG